MKGFIKVGNRIFDYKLTPKALFTYAYLLSRTNCLQAVSAAYAQIAESCHMDMKTAQAAIKELISKRLVTKQNHFNARGYISNRYYVTSTLQGSNGWFMVEREVFHTVIKSTDFMVFCFIRKCMNGKTREAFPSLTAIANGTGLSRSRIVQSVGYLRRFSFINRIKRRYKQTKAYRHSRYMEYHFRPLEKGKKGKKRAHTLKGTGKNKTVIVIVPQLQRDVNPFFGGGWFINSQTLIRPTRFTYKKVQLWFLS